MMKNKWFMLSVALLAAFGLIFVGCSNGSSGNDDGDDPGKITGGNYRDVILDEFDIVDHSDQHDGWSSNGYEGAVTSLDIADLTAAKYLVLELSSSPAGGLNMVWQGVGPGVEAADWNQNEGILDPNNGSANAAKGATFSDGVLKIELSKALASPSMGNGYDKFTTLTGGKLILCYYSPNITGLGITKAYLQVAVAE